MLNKVVILCPTVLPKKKVYPIIINIRKYKRQLLKKKKYKDITAATPGKKISKLTEYVFTHRRWVKLHIQKPNWCVKLLLGSRVGLWR